MKSEETYLACKKKKYRDKCCSKLRILKMMDVSNENKERRERESVIQKKSQLNDPFHNELLSQFDKEL